MPRLMSPLRPRYMRYPTDIPREGLQVHPLPRENDAAHGDTATPQDALKNASGNQAPDTAADTFEEPQYPETIRISEGTFRQIRDYSLVLLSQGITHRIMRSEEGPFQIFILPENEDRARLQLALYRKENPPREENPPLPLSLSLQPLWVLLVPVVCTLLDFSGKVARMHSLGLSDADKVMHGQWWRTITALTLHGDARHIASNLVSGYIVLNLMSYRTPLARMAPFLAVASALANFCTVLTVQTDYRSLGFSTFVFAAIGALSVTACSGGSPPSAAPPRSPYSSASARTPTCWATPTGLSRGSSAGSSQRRRRSAGERLPNWSTSCGSLSISRSSLSAGNSL